jgi:hypothetical protein
MRHRKAMIPGQQASPGSQNYQFVLTLNMMCDVLPHLSDLFKAMQVYFLLFKLNNEQSHYYLKELILILQVYFLELTSTGVFWAWCRTMT